MNRRASRFLPDRSHLQGRYSGRRMLFLPGGTWQVPVIELARMMGFYVICADGTPHAPGFAAADEGVQISLQDSSGLVELGRSRRVDVVMTEQTDFAVPMVARVSDALGLPGLPVAVADAATNKRLMREAAQSAGIRQPRFRGCRTVDDVRAAVEELGLPLFYKPVDAQSSRGVGVLETDDMETVSCALQRATSASVCGEASFEELILGTECTVEGFVVDGKPTTLAISDKEHYADLPGVARTLTWPPAFPQAVINAIAHANEATVRAIGIPFGITHAEFLIDAHGEPWLVEIAGRGGGSRIPTHIVPAVTGFDPTPALIDSLMGASPSVDKTEERACQLRFLRLPAGRVLRAVRNADELRSLPGVLDLHFNFQPGDRIPDVGDDRSRHGFVIAAGENRAEAIALADEVEHRLVFDLGD
ncbi:MAG: ATP-grasp domain-containing protein [Planctomycetaceae bacterium]